MKPVPEFRSFQKERYRISTFGIRPCEYNYEHTAKGCLSRDIAVILWAWEQLGSGFSCVPKAIVEGMMGIMESNIPHHGGKKRT